MASPKFSTSLAEQAGIGPRTNLDYQSILRLLALIEARFLPLEGQSSAIDEAIESLRRVGLDRINDALRPALEWVLDVQSKGFLIAESSTSATLGEGNILDLNVPEGSQRELFTPSPFVVVSRKANPDDFAIARTIAYDSANGRFLCQVISHYGDPGPFDDWVIGALAGSTIAQHLMLADATSVRDISIAAAQAADESAGMASSSAATATSARDTINAKFRIGPTPPSDPSPGQVWLKTTV